MGAAGNVDYPAGVGASCKAWDSTADPDCAGKTDGWCVNAWCYVDPCTCELDDPVSSGYFPGLKVGNGDRAFYSYAACGNVDEYSCESTDPADVANQGCPCSKEEGACEARKTASGGTCVWDAGKCIASELRGGCVAAGKEDKDCPCIDLADLDSSKQAGYPDYNQVKYPAAVGTSCRPWDKAADPSCAGKTDGWCVDSWCYVDPCNCKTDTPKKSSYFPNLETSSGDPAYYSYETCGSADSFTGSAADLSKVACPLIKDEAKCGARSDCGWADTGRCLGIEYLNACPDSIDDHEDCSCIDASHIDASDEPKYPFYEAGNVDYPAAVGSFCKAWDKTADPGCDGATDGWCLDAWCYVDPCTCKHGIPVASGYFPNLKTDTGDRLFYSYQTCGLDKDKYSCEATDPESVANQGCPCNSDQTTCSSDSNCLWNDGQCIAKELAGGCLADKAQAAIPNPTCPCIPLADIDTASQADYPHYGTDGNYPAAVGTSCRAWDSTQAACAGENPAAWCAQAWCYVDPCSCGLTDPAKSSYFPDLETMHGLPLYYSYSTCGGVDTFTGSSDDATKRACALNKDAASCGAGCLWQGGRCIGEELKGVGC